MSTTESSNILSAEPSSSTNGEEIHERLVTEILRVVKTDPKQWTAGDTMLLLSIAPRSVRGAFVNLLAMQDEFGDGMDSAALWVRMQLVANVDWQALLNPEVRRKSMFSLKAKGAEVGLLREIERRQHR